MSEITQVSINIHLSENPDGYADVGISLGHLEVCFAPSVALDLAQSITSAAETANAARLAGQRFKDLTQ